jgi:type II secretory pathway component PulK
MSLRALKKEVELLPDLRKYTKDLHTHFLQPLQSSFVATTMVAPQLKQFKQQLQDVQSQHIHQKLRTYARYLIELKLTTLNGDKQKSALLTNKFLQDDFLNLKRTIEQIKFFEEKVAELTATYQEINELLQQELSLEDALHHLHAPHKLPLNNLQKAVQQQKKLVKELGGQFVSLMREVHQ